VSAKRIYLSPPHLGSRELEYIQDAFRKNWITTAGENIDQFEKSICTVTNTEYAVALNSGTAAIHLALKLLGINIGDEVICSTFTFVASANPILYLGAIPVFVDSEKETWNMSPELLEIAVKDRIQKGKKPKAIVLVHLYGQPAKLHEIIRIAQNYDIPLIEDAAESLGSTYEGKMTGTFGLMGIYSFNGNKIITTSGGGMLISNNKLFIERAKFLSTQSRDTAPYYQHSEIGFNYRLSNVLAGIGIGQLELLQERIKRKRSIFEYYKSRLETSSQFIFPKEMENTFGNRWLTTVLLNQNTPEFYKSKLESNNIESRFLWKPLHLQPLFKDMPKYIDGTSEVLFNKGLCLPSGTAMTDEDLDRVVKSLE